MPHARRGLLDRRTFLQSYDSTQSPDRAIRERILTAVVPVAGRISLEYYFSRVDNVRYGCGTKVPHTVTGLIGVMDGAQSDLRTGLPYHYVERNALRAKLVDHAETWQWGSLWRLSQDNEKLTAWLSEWPVERPRDRVRRVNRPDTKSELEALRLSVTRGRPFGEEGWVRRLCKRCGMESTLRPRGAPKAPEKRLLIPFLYPRVFVGSYLHSLSISPHVEIGRKRQVASGAPQFTNTRFRLMLTLVSTSAAEISGCGKGGLRA